MKKIIIFSTLVVIIHLINTIQAQTINWSNTKRGDKHILHIGIGFEYGVIYAAGYGYQLKNKLFPLICNIEYSSPLGNDIADDYKTKIGGQIRWIKYRNFQFSTKVYGVFRRYENEYACLKNFGSDLSGIIGYYRPKWFAAAESGFDKAIVTHFKHSKAYKNQYPEVKNGWYEPSTGGNFYYGLQMGFSFRKHDIYLRAGKILTQDFKTKPMVPIFGQLGYNMRL